MRYKYNFHTTWRLEAPIDEVWQALYHVEDWPRWWKYIARVDKLKAGDSKGLGQINRFVFSTALPYKFVFKMRVSRLEEPGLIEGIARGELNGIGLWKLHSEGDVTVVHYTWQVNMRKRLLNLFAPVFQPFFLWNHDVVMRAGGTGLAKLLGCRLLE